MKTQIWNSNSQTAMPEVPAAIQRQTQMFTSGSGSSAVAKTANVLCLDHSGSTSSAIGHNDNRSIVVGVKEAASTFAVNLLSTAMLGIISFESLAKVECKMETVEGKKLNFVSAVQKLQSAGGTSMTEALELAKKMLTKAPADYQKRIYLITDGMSTDGDPTPTAERLKLDGTQIFCIGFGEGSDIDEATMRAMASVSESGESFFQHFTDEAKMTGFLKRQTSTVSI